ESRHLVEEEVEPVVVVEHHRDVGLLADEEFVDRIEAVEKRLPVRVPLQTPGDRVADPGDAAGEEAADDRAQAASPRSVTPSASGDAVQSSTGRPVCSEPRSCTSRPKMPASLAR